MPAVDLLLAILIGLVQGVVEWLPISSEGAVSILLSMWGYGPTAAVQLALFLHAGTALAASIYYRNEVRALVSGIPRWHPHTAFEGEAATLSFLVLATAVSAAVGLTGYYFLLEAASELAGGAFIALIGGLLVLTGVMQRLASEATLTEPEVPRRFDAVLVGIGQGLAVLPGISRSGTTVSVLLLRGYDGESAFEFSFILSIPAALGAGVLAGTDVGSGGLAPLAGLVALGTSAVVGYVTIGALLRFVRRLAFWGVCVGFGSLAIVGGLLVGML